ncbi:hypothetical protein HV299_07190 [Klebsiella grimontii]|uniref:hypothetical protein n=1 Tax=Klebsiella grimontii TaxID=2058152 RepID=UPI0015E96252|nr:hypothetical protein [Klebsiella grimontii]QLT08175.1 hypothetical protein HV299_07190 [Klebsiella grimontii]
MQTSEENMSFSVKKTVTPLKVFSSLLGAAIRGDSEEINVTYEITSIISLSGTEGVAEYSVEPEGAAMTGRGEFPFIYSGSGNPLEEAENALRDSLTAG